ncbi:uncharacterized protein LOC129909465 [Episyrphus balteatus]|uniref:uncharacterized protein LOC129909465 n=1 Tax=Episyrphus balteatus TaxID=286459 RepID=UPI002485AF0F|nr:uncharacterized protein LOC129909465 [Episyrphus balteatus]
MGLRCIQINLQHAKAASTVLSHRFNKEHLDIAFIQEPYIVKDQIKGLSGELIYDSSSEGRPRACIMINKSIITIPIPQYANKDMVPAIIQLHTSEGRSEAVICSVYLAGDSADLSFTPLQDLIDYCGRTGRQIITSCDANAHHTVWGSSNINKRGNAIQNWHFSTETSMSDHRQISFDICIESKLPLTYRQPRATNWDDYCLEISQTIRNCPNSIRDIDSLEISCNSLNATITTAYHNACPEKTKSGTRKTPWWNAKLSKLRTLTRKLFNKAKRNGDWTSYRTSLTNYNTEIRRAKRESWKKFCNDLSDIQSSARIHRILAKEHTNHIGLLKNTDGMREENGPDTLQILTDTHFPNSVVIPSDLSSPSPQFRLTRPNREDWKRARDMFYEGNIKWAINSFDPYKSPGEDGIFPALLQKGNELITPMLINIFRTSYAWGYLPTS